VLLRHHGKKSAERDYRHARYAIRRFGNAPLDQLSPEPLTQDVDWLLDHGGRQHPEGRPLGPTTARHIAFGVHACLDQAVDWDIIAKNPMKRCASRNALGAIPRWWTRMGSTDCWTK
jgi:hypothetical protein